MDKLQILNGKERKVFLKHLTGQFGFTGELKGTFLRNSKDKIFLIDNSVFTLEFERLRIDSMGLYIATDMGTVIRLSVEGSQIIGPHATKMVVDVSTKERCAWMSGKDLEIDYEKGFVIIKCGPDYIGCGKSTGEKIINYFPKIRRIGSM